MMVYNVVTASRGLLFYSNGKHFPFAVAFCAVGHREIKVYFSFFNSVKGANERK